MAARQVINVDGVWWGAAAQIAAHLGHGVTAAVVRSWARRDGLPSARLADDCGRPQVQYPLPEAAAIDVAKRHAQRGRRRSRQAAALEVAKTGDAA